MDLYEVFSEQLAKTEVITEEKVEEVVTSFQKAVEEGDPTTLLIKNTMEENGVDPIEDLLRRWPVGDRKLFAIVETRPAEGKKRGNLEVIGLLESDLETFEERYEFIHVGTNGIPKFREL